MRLCIKTLFLLLFFYLIFLPKNIEARSGCCSHHDGVCGCRCCDGSSLSATCAPYYPSCGSTTKTVKTIQPTSIPKPTLIPTKIPTIVPTLKPTIQPTSIPTKTIVLTPTIINIQPTIPLKSTTSNSSNSSLGGLVVLGGLGFGGYKLVKKFKK